MGTVKFDDSISLNSSPFFRIAAEISEITGVVLQEKQRSLIISRLNKRIRELGISSEEEYSVYYKNNYEAEKQELISLLTTHYTFFFREITHFDFLTDNLETIISKLKLQGRKEISVWCAACSYGQEVYSIALLLENYLKKSSSDVSFKIFGSDVDKESVKHSRNGVYKWDEIKKIPSVYIDEYWQRGTGKISNFVKIKSNIRKNCEFDVVNLKKLNTELGDKKFDIIFCRNVFIYFEDTDIRSIVGNMKKHMYDNAYLFIGLSENIDAKRLKLTHYGKSIYGLTNKVDLEVVNPVSKINNIVNEPHSIPHPIAPKIKSNFEAISRSTSKKIRVLTVDDSPTVLTLLKKILSSESGFEVVGHAKNGFEAHEFLNSNTNVDIVTLDIHMPKMTGLEYLQKHFGKDHPPVVVVSSVSREDGELAMGCLRAGASDYVEKPTLQELSAKSEEITSKLKAVVNLGSHFNIGGLESEFKRSRLISNVEKKLKVIIAPLSSREKVLYILRSVKKPQPPHIILFENAGSLTPALCSDFQNDLGEPVEEMNVAGADIMPSKLYLGTGEDLSLLNKQFDDRKIVITVLGDLSSTTVKLISTLPKAILVLEDVGIDTDTTKVLQPHSAVFFPYTSLAYEADKILIDSDEDGQ
ncbi:MAG: response regulator [Bdellovibrionaceae bacterium]|nr:response regulator [Pseudobdellovibrionaceae bacterium]